MVITKTLNGQFTAGYDYHTGSLRCRYYIVGRVEKIMLITTLCWLLYDDVSTFCLYLLAIDCQAEG